MDSLGATAGMGHRIPAVSLRHDWKTIVEYNNIQWLCQCKAFTATDDIVMAAPKGFARGTSGIDGCRYFATNPAALRFSLWPVLKQRWTPALSAG